MLSVLCLGLLFDLSISFIVVNHVYETLQEMLLCKQKWPEAAYIHKFVSDRTIGYYNVQDNSILETTSNPFWAAAIYCRLREVEANAVNNPEDPRVDRGLEQSAIQKYMALGILFNGNKSVID